MPRTPTVTVPNSTALPRANREPDWKVSAPGFVTSSTPMNPTISAPHRTAPTGSLRKMTAAIVNSGAEKLMATALASGIRLKAISRNDWDVACEMPRMRWAPGRLVRNTANPVNGRIARLAPTSEVAERENSTSPTG